MKDVIIPMSESLIPIDESREARKASVTRSDTKYSNAHSSEYAFRERLYAGELKSVCSIAFIVFSEIFSSGVIISQKTLFVNRS